MSEREQKNITGAICLILLVLVIVLLVQINGLGARLASVQDELAATRIAMTEITDQNEQILGDIRLLKTEVQRTAERIALLREEMSQAIAIATGIQLSNPGNTSAEIQTANIPNGVYEFTQEISIFAADTREFIVREFTVYTVKTTMGDEDVPVVAGIATTLGAPHFFVDHDGDNRVDLQVMRSLVEFVPYSALVTKSMSRRNAQTIYDVFLTQYEQASFISEQDIADRATGIPKSIWDLVVEHSSIITNWGEGE
jgi:hypothetical protein